MSVCLLELCLLLRFMLAGMVSYKLYYQYTRVGIDDVHTNISPALASSIHQYNRVFDYLYTHIKCIFCVFMCFVLKATL